MDKARQFIRQWYEITSYLSYLWYTEHHLQRIYVFIEECSKHFRKETLNKEHDQTICRVPALSVHGLMIS